MISFKRFLLPALLLFFGCGTALAQSASFQAWGVNSAGQIWQWTGNGPWKNIPGSLTDVSIGSDGSVWGVNAGGTVFRRTGDTWSVVEGAPALVQLSVRNATEVWGVTADDTVKRWNGSQWLNVQGKLKNLSVAADGSVYGVNRGGKPWRWTGDGWQPMPGGLTQISVAKSGDAWGVNSADQLWRWDGKTWSLLADKQLSSVAVAADGTAWGLDRSGSIFRNEAGQWKQVQGGLVRLSVAVAAPANPDSGSIPITLNQNLNIQAPPTVVQVAPVPNISAPPVVISGILTMTETAPAPAPAPAPRQGLVVTGSVGGSSYPIGAVGTSKATCGVAGTGLCAAERAQFIHNASLDCPDGSFPDLGKSSCWSCPAGYTRSLAAVDSEKACQKPDPNQRGGFFAATYRGALCEAPSFHDPIRGGECYTCPEGYKRSLAHIDAPNACFVPAGEEFKRAEKVRSTIWPHECSSGTFWDGYNGGGCYTCGGYNRTGYPISDAKSCSRAVAEKQQTATNKGKAQCGPGEFFDPKIKGEQNFARGGGCWTCPTATDRTILPVDGGSACERAPGLLFASATRTKAMTCEATEIFDPINSNNSSMAWALKQRNAMPDSSPVSAAASGGTCWTCPAGSKRTVSEVYGGSACQPVGIKWQPAPYNQPGLFGLAGAEAVALKLVQERTLINEIIAGMKQGATAGSVPANFSQTVWDEIGTRPQDSAALKIAVFSRLVAAANSPSSATPDEIKLLDSAADNIKKFRIFMAQDALDAYRAWKGGQTYREGMYARSQLQTMVDVGTVPPDFEDITAETILGSLGASSASTTAIGLGLLPQVVRAKLFPHAFRATYYSLRAAQSAARSAAVAARLTQEATKIAVEAARAGAQAGAGISAMAASIGPQIIVTIGIEVLAVAIEQQIDIANAEPKLLTGLATAKNLQVDFPRLMSTQTGSAVAEGYWANLMSGPARVDGQARPAKSPDNLEAFASAATAAKSAL